MIEVLQPGVFTTFQDLGRHGFEAQGVPTSGAFDPFLACVANRLVGNSLSATLLEFALVGPTLKIHSEVSLAIVSHSSLYLLNGTPVPQRCAFRAGAGSELRFVNMEGWFGYIAIGGGFQSDKVLGSASVYLPGRIGTRIEKGITLRNERETNALYSISDESLQSDAASRAVPILPALHTEYFSTIEREKIEKNEFKILTQSNRMGIRLEGPAIEPPNLRRSAPTTVGTLQLPTSGQPILLGPDGPTTGGYPQMAVVARSAWTQIAAKRPGSSISFQWISKQEARKMYDQKFQIFDSMDLWKRID